MAAKELKIENLTRSIVYSSINHSPFYKSSFIAKRHISLLMICFLSQMLLSFSLPTSSSSRFLLKIESLAFDRVFLVYLLSIKRTQWFRVSECTCFDKSRWLRSCRTSNLDLNGISSNENLNGALCLMHYKQLFYLLFSCSRKEIVNSKWSPFCLFARRLNAMIKFSMRRT